MAQLSYRELQARLKELEPVIGDVDRSAPKTELQKIYDEAIATIEATAENTPLEVATLQPPIEPVFVETKPKAKKQKVDTCNVCGGDMSISDGWLRCNHCTYKEFQR